MVEDLTDYWRDGAEGPLQGGWVTLPRWCRVCWPGGLIFAHAGASGPSHPQDTVLVSLGRREAGGERAGRLSRFCSLVTSFFPEAGR